MTARPRSIRLTPRDIPSPSSISPEAQAALERLIDADGVPVNARFTMPDHDDVAGVAGGQGIGRCPVCAHAGRGLGRAHRRGRDDPVRRCVVHVATPAAPIAEDAVYIDLHGGALVFGGGEACRHGARTLADQLGLRVWSIDYRLPPEHPFPAGLDDGLAAYRAALRLYPAERIVVGGRSAGGNLAAAMLLRAKAEGLPLPAGLVLLSPQVDLTESGDSFVVNAGVDGMLPTSLMSSNRLYAGGADLSDPLVSPLFGDVANFPRPSF